MGPVSEVLCASPPPDSLTLNQEGAVTLGARRKSPDMAKRE